MPAAPNMQTATTSTPAPVFQRSRRFTADGLRRLATIATLLPALPAALIFIVGGIDLVLTLNALETGLLVELNPVTRLVIETHGAAGLVAWRLSTSTIGAALLYWALGAHALEAEAVPARRHRRSCHVVGAGVGVIAATHIGLLLWWTAWFAI